jgi:hypothetical protein
MEKKLKPCICELQSTLIYFDGCGCECSDMYIIISVTGLANWLQCIMAWHLVVAAKCTGYFLLGSLCVIFVIQQCIIVLSAIAIAKRNNGTGAIMFEKSFYLEL